MTLVGHDGQRSKIALDQPTLRERIRLNGSKSDITTDIHAFDVLSPRHAAACMVCT